MKSPFSAFGFHRKEILTKLIEIGEKIKKLEDFFPISINLVRISFSRKPNAEKNFMNLMNLMNLMNH